MPAETSGRTAAAVFEISIAALILDYRKVLAPI